VVTVTLNVVSFIFSTALGIWSFALCSDGAFREAALSAKMRRFFGLVPAHQEEHPNTDSNHQNTAYGN